MTDFSTVAVSGTDGIWITDILNVGDLPDVNMTMGLTYDMSEPYGVLGLQYKGPTNYAAVWSLMSEMVSQGATVTQAYSLACGSTDATNGSILFSAIDTEKYVGDLMSLDAYYLSNNDYRTVVTLASVKANSSSGIDDLADGLPVSIGVWIGRQGMVVPPELAFAMWAVVGAVYWSSLDAATVPCSMRDSEGSFVIGLGGDEGPTVSIPMRSLVTPETGLGENCLFMVANNTDPGNYYLGEAFLQNVYAVFDLANTKLALATPRADSTTSNIVPFASASAPIPSTVSVASQLTRPVTETPTVTEMPAATATKSYSAAAGFLSASATTTAANTPTSETSSTNRTTAIGVGVGVGVGIAALAAVGAAFFFIRRRKSQKAEPASDKGVVLESPPNGFQASEPPKYQAELEGPHVAYELPPDAVPAELNSGSVFHDPRGHYVELPTPSDMAYSPNPNRA